MPHIPIYYTQTSISVPVITLAYFKPLQNNFVVSKFCNKLNEIRLEGYGGLIEGKGG